MLKIIIGKDPGGSSSATVYGGVYTWEGATFTVYAGWCGPGQRQQFLSAHFSQVDFYIYDDKVVQRFLTAKKEDFDCEAIAAFCFTKLKSKDIAHIQQSSYDEGFKHGIANAQEAMRDALGIPKRY